MVQLNMPIEPIEEKTRCLPVGGKVPLLIWTETFSTAVYLLNRLPVSNKKYPIPYCLSNNISPNKLDLSHLRIFFVHKRMFTQFFLI